MALALTVISAATGWYYASPWWTLRQVRIAIEERDATALASHIDFPTLREQLKAQMRTRYVYYATSSGDPVSFEAVASSPRMIGIERTIDALLTPQSLQMAFAELSNRRLMSAADRPKAPDYTLRHSGLDEFDIVFTDYPTLGIVFHRDGLGWKVSDARLPFDLVEAFANRPVPR